jgi:hypothetical protein
LHPSTLNITFSQMNFLLQNCSIKWNQIQQG